MLEMCYKIFMPLLDIFKKRKKVKEKKEVKKPPRVKVGKKVEKPKKVKEVIEKKPPEVRVEKKPEKKPEEEKVKERKLKVETYRILREPQITEKATDLGKENKYVFKVYPRANKVEIKKAIEDLYEVDVLTVRIIKIPPKSRRLGRTRGQRKGYKKAIVKVKKGQKIELLPR